jgi:lysophospholipase L1-like esterase
MKKFILLSCSLWILLLPQKPKRVIFFGDSITELGARPGGFIPRIDSLSAVEKKHDQFEFVGAGVGANKVYDLYLRIEDDVLSKNPDVVLIYIGVNDVWHKTLLGTGTDPDKFEKFYQAILNKLKANNIRFILCTPALIGEKNDMSNPLDGDLNRYSNIVRALATKNNCPLVDLRNKFLEYEQQNNPANKDKGLLTYDGVHMIAAGNELLAELMWQEIQKM